jgi:ribosomal protein L3 glutamine methyltransferase
VLDLCTGNGSLAVLAAMAWPEVQVTGADLSEDALAVARINIERHGLADRIRLAGRRPAAVAGQTFDLILCNPPYVNAEAMAALPPGIPRRTPARPVRQCRRRTRRHGLHPPAAARPRRTQNPGAVLVLEIGHERDFFEAAFHLDVVWLPTSAGDDQVLLVTMR